MKDIQIGNLSDQIDFSNNQKRIVYAIVAICMAIFFPLSVKNFLIGEYLLSGLLFAFGFGVCIDALAIQIGKTDLPINVHLLVITLVLAEILTVKKLGFYGIFWVFPISVTLLFILKTVHGIFYSTVMMIAVSVIAFMEMEIGLALRVFSAFAATLGITLVILQAIEQLQNKIHDESIRDPLTGLFNRRQLQIHLKDCLAQFKRHGKNVSMLLIDIDHFKKVNDQYGHEMGDVVLKGVAELLSKNTREEDLLFRLGGEEFLILLREHQSNEAQLLAEKLRAKVKETRFLNQHPVSISVGVCQVFDGLDHDSWMRHADDALYRAKENGRDRVEVFKQAA